MKIGSDLTDPKRYPRLHTLKITALKCTPALYLTFIPPILSDVLLQWQKIHIYFIPYSIEHIFNMGKGNQWLDIQAKVQKPN